MKKVKKISIILITAILICFLGTTTVSAAGLTLKVTADNDELEVGEEVIITVDWTEKMQAADFILKYDKEKMEYVSSSIGDGFSTNDATNGQVKIVWASLDDKDLTNITMTFKAKAIGEAEFSVEIDGGFADGEMNSPDSYDVTTYGKTKVEIVSYTEIPLPEDPEDPTDPDEPTEPENPISPVYPTEPDEPADPEEPTDSEKEDTTTLDTEIPKAGANRSILIALLLLIGIVSISYSQIKKYRGI